MTSIEQIKNNKYKPYKDDGEWVNIKELKVEGCTDPQSQEWWFWFFIFFLFFFLFIAVLTW